MKKRETYRLEKGCEVVAGLGGAAFSYCIVNNLRLFQDEIELFNGLLKPKEDYVKKYQPLIEETAKKFCINDSKGKPIPKVLENGNTIFDFTPENKIAFDQAIDDLEKKPEFKKMVAVRKAQLKKHGDLMDQESTLKLEKINRKDLPKEITPAQLDMIFEMVK